MPIGNASAEPVVVKYPSEGGGSSESDTWELYVGADKLIDEFIFRRGGARKPQRRDRDREYKKAGPLLISTDHRGTADEKPVRISFSDVSVKVTGSENWMGAR